MFIHFIIHNLAGRLVEKANARPDTHTEPRAYAGCNGQAYGRKARIAGSHVSPVPKTSSGIGTIHIAAYVVLGIIGYAEVVVICYLAKKVNF